MSASAVEFEIRTPRADDFERDVSPLLGAHRLQVQGRATRSAFYLRHKALSRLSLSTVRYGRPVGVEVLAERGHWSVTKVAAGCVAVGSGAQQVSHRQGDWTVYAPDRADALAFDAAGEVQTLALPLQAMEAALTALLGHPAHGRCSWRTACMPRPRRRGGWTMSPAGCGDWTMVRPCPRRCCACTRSWRCTSCC